MVGPAASGGRPASPPPSLLAPRTTDRPRRAREGRDESVRHGAEFSGSWQQGHSATYNTPSQHLSRLQRIQIAGSELCFRAPPPTSPPAKGAATTRVLGSRKAPNVGRQAGGEGGAGSSLDSDLEALSHNPTHGSHHWLFNQADDQLCESTVPLALG
ncbi:hypothetical protein H6P81_021208 [Aristolochia fimbriata]|uniref:Uncharacterized protein n=1 Tax=Aristolochia fimbriata TaxID=158543 RepID=A0AAV7DQE8_ARIFI|nr:hypothetical protein H6P81_021208 [Aristolochia fimbriata]